MLTIADLTTAFRAVGLTGGDTVLVHSSLRKLGPVEGGADGVIEALLAAVGGEGTVAVPTHSYANVHAMQPVFHQTLTPSIVGTLTNVFRNRPEAMRSLHPTHSVAAIGARAAEFVRDHEKDDTPCSPTSPYGKLITWGGKVLIIGRGLECCTFFHCCEELAACPWLFASSAQLYSITAEGRVIPVPSRLHGNGVSDLYPLLEEALVNIGALTLGAAGGCSLRVVDARKSSEWLVAELRKDAELLRKFKRVKDI